MMSAREDAGLMVLGVHNVARTARRGTGPQVFRPMTD
jgi:hypothetical protein